MTLRRNGATLNDLLCEFDGLRSQIDRAFDQVGIGDRTFPFSQSSFLPGMQARSYPLANVSEDGDAVYVEALAPGVDPSTLSLSVLQDQLSISGEKPALPGDIQPERYHRNERAAGKFVRTVQLPSEVDPDEVKADFHDGMLLVTLPISETAKPKRITVNVN